MKAHLVLPLAMAATLIAPSVGAQDDAPFEPRQTAQQTFGDPANVDEFAVPRETTPTRVLAPQQITDTEASRSPVPTEMRERDRATAPDDAGSPTRPTEGDSAPIEQIAGRDNSTRGTQLSAPGAHELAQQDIASDADSRPVAILRIKGEDRCDPGQPPELLARCETILERRAAEFAAAEAPRLSAEQVLLAGQGDSDRLLASSSNARGLRLASQADPDSNSDTNQELASIYLARNPGTNTTATAPEEDPNAVADLPSALIEALRGLDTPGAPPPP